MFMLVLTAGVSPPGSLDVQWQHSHLPPMCDFCLRPQRLTILKWKVTWICPGEVFLVGNPQAIYGSLRDDYGDDF